MQTLRRYSLSTELYFNLSKLHIKVNKYIKHVLIPGPIYCTLTGFQHWFQIFQDYETSCMLGGSKGQYQ